MKIETILEKTSLLAQEFAQERDTRQRRKKADPADFQRMKDAGIHLMAVPTEFGGTWESLAQSTRPIFTVLRTMALGDPSVSLVSAMHPLVLSPWRIPNVPKPHSDAWAQQRREVYETVVSGMWWGTIVSEPGSGGDRSKTRAVAVPVDSSELAYRLTGRKHFGSGSGVTSFMATTAIPAGETEPDGVFLDVRDVPWDGSTGMRLVAEWDGHGMMSTNSHAFEFQDFPATRVAWPRHQTEIMGESQGLGRITMSAVIAGVVDAAMAYMRERLKGSMAQGSQLRAFQQVEWTMAEQEAWLIDQAYESTLRIFDRGVPTGRNPLLAKENIARLSESVLNRLCKISGGGAYTRYTPLGAWLEDVRALGYLRPPWALAFDELFEMGWRE